PPTLPLLGNIHVLPTRNAHNKFTEWARQYGGIYSLKIGTGTIIVLSNMTHVKELLDKRTAATASRPQNYVADMITKGLYFAFIPNNSLWRLQRKLVNAIISPNAVSSYLPIQASFNPLLPEYPL
ncbi:hypothetical protein MPER_10416, partial [Moniliophthora perniciosa FA553]